MPDGGAMRTLEGVQPTALPLQDLVAAGEPVVLRGIARDWGLVQAGLRSTQDAMAYLRGFDAGVPVPYSFGEPRIEGRPFYNAEFTALNFEVRRGPLTQVLEAIAATFEDPRPPTYYVASLPIARALPGFAQANDAGLAGQGIDALASIWIGNRVTASCHFDTPDNLACCAVGRRRVTLFPPEQIDNLYPGPLDPTPGGQVVSVVDVDRPDFARYPRFRDALASARHAELEPGDALFIPSMWWHHVRSLAQFNVLVNYWWRSAPAFLPSPLTALQHAMWALRDLPAREKQAWAKLFDYYVFGPGERAGQHLPEAARGELAPFDEARARRVRAQLLARLNR
ncbi:cupin-like domain-containing protein [Xanthomonas sacchari]|uniref:Cupin-like domain-containing protein n=2 Tax=Xanthomonas sacchari TaxID=56458 RepID=A0A2P5Z1T0_9XANT|nr:cupin-like domain-containing protein [Xanthomonas sacchari]MDV0439296.1 cupin-like domain-containing protein [Xanthomonas sacchari]PPU81470.1 cupin-like domain-containing protein [Xanthomonas sacchari]